VEGHHFDARKHVLEYDDVINKHREIIYKRRDAVLSHSEASAEIETSISEMVYNKVQNLVLAEEAKQGDAINKNKLVKRVHEYLGRPIIDDFLEKEDISAIT
jgi:preprotein translocase subunit SecA